MQCGHPLVGSGVPRVAPFSQAAWSRSPVSLLPPRWVHGPVAGLLGQRPWPLTCEHGESGGLPCAVVAQKHRDLPLIQVQVQVSDGHLALVPHSEHLRQRQREPWTVGPAPSCPQECPRLACRRVSISAEVGNFGQGLTGGHAAPSHSQHPLTQAGPQCLSLCGEHS